MVDVSDDSDSLKTSKVVVVCTQIENLMYVTRYILCEVDKIVVNKKINIPS